MIEYTKSIETHSARIVTVFLIALLLFSLATSESHAQNGRREIAFVDPSVRNHQAFVFRDLSTLEVVILKPNIPLLEQISKSLESKSDIRAIHLLSHGEAGRVLTDGEVLDVKKLHEIDKKAISTIRMALAPGADMLLYGCNIASTQNGKQFVREISHLLGIDVSASTNNTGHITHGADWNLEFKVGEVESVVALSNAAINQWQDKLTVGISVASNSSTLLNALSPTGMNGVTYSGSPSILGNFSSNSYGTFTTTSSNLGMASGVILGTGNILGVSGSPSTLWDGPGTGVSLGSERDRAALTFSFIPEVGVNKVVFRYVMGSEEYNEYVGQGFSDNISIRLNGGIYSSTNIATVPNTSTGIDIDTINASLNSAYYRDNSITSPPIPDSVLDGHTTVLSSIATVVPGTTYSAEIKVADFNDNELNSAIFVSYFGAGLQLDLDRNNSSGATAANYVTTFTEAGSAVAIADLDTGIVNFDTTSIQSATITLTNAQPNDLLSYGAMPSGIAASTNTSVPGKITVTLSGSSTLSNYQAAISAILFSNASNVPNTTLRNITVVVNDSTTNSNTAVSSVSVVAIPTYIYSVLNQVNSPTVNTPSALNYTVTLTNLGDGVISGVNLVDTLVQGSNSFPLVLSGPLGDAGVVGQLDIGETWTYSTSFNVTQVNMDSGSDLVATLAVTTAQTSPAMQMATATTTVTKLPNLTISKTANKSGPVVAGETVVYSYRIRNSGNITINNVSISDLHNGYGLLPNASNEMLTSDVLPLGDSVDVSTDNNWDKLAPGDEVVFTTSYVVVQADIDNLQ